MTTPTDPRAALGPIAWTEGDDDFDPIDVAEAEIEDWLACGRWDQRVVGGMTASCALAGTEFCDFDCPHNKPACAARPGPEGEDGGCVRP